MSEVDRVAADPNATAAECVGAAIVTTQPIASPGPWLWMCTRGASQLLWSQEFLSNGLAGRNHWPDEVVSARNVRSLELFTRATELEPDEVNWWRLRALTACIGDRRRSESVALDLAWFDEAKRRDPRNALYDYLLGMECYRFATPEYLRFQEDGYEGEVILNFEFYRKFLRYYRAALSKPILATGVAGTAAVGQFFVRAPGSASDKYIDTQSWMPYRMLGAFFGGLNTPFFMGIEEHVEKDDIAGAFHLWKKATLRWIEQSRRANEPMAMTSDRFRSWRYFESILTNQFNDRPISEAAKLAIQQAERLSPPSSADVQWEVARNEFDDNVRREWEFLSFMQQFSFVGISAGTFGYLLLAMGIVGYAVSRILNRNVTGETPPAAHPARAFVWPAVLVASFALLGLLPAFQPSVCFYPSVTNAIVMVLFCVPICIFSWWSGRYVFKQGRLPKRQRSWAYHVLRWALVVQGSLIFIAVLLLAVDPKIRAWVMQPPGHSIEFLIAERGVGESVAPYELARSLGLSQQSVGWSIVQWGLHQGLYLTAAVGSFVLVALNWWRARRSEVDAVFTRSQQIRIRLANAVGATSKTTIVFAFVLLLVAVATTTEWINCLRCQYDREVARLSDPFWMAKVVGAKVKEIEAAAK